GGLYLNRPDPRGFLLQGVGLPILDLVPVGVAFAAVDRDGDLDLTLCGQGGVRLLANDGAAHFQDVTVAAGVGGAVDDISQAVAWGDLDGAGSLDLVVANYGLPLQVNDAQASRIYLNRRDGTFAEL